MTESNIDALAETSSHAAVIKESECRTTQEEIDREFARLCYVKGFKAGYQAKQSPADFANMEEFAFKNMVKEYKGSLERYGVDNFIAGYQAAKQSQEQVGEWQLCPKCNGDGNLARYNSPSIISTDASLLCDICNGAKIIAKPIFQPPKQEQVAGVLKALKDITDEDILKIGALFHDEYEWKIVTNNEINIIIECEDYRIFIWKDDDDFIDFDELYKGKENIEAHGCESEPCSPYRSIIDIIDYLRYKGYNLPNKFESQQPKKEGK